MENIRQTLNKYFYYTGKVTIHPDKTVDVDGTVMCLPTVSKQLPVTFGNVLYFNCNNATLTTLVGSPHTVEEFECEKNSFTSLDGAPRNVIKYFNCTSNNLTSLNGLPQNAEEVVLTYNENLGLLKLITNNIRDLDIRKGPDIVRSILNQYRKKSNLTATPEQRNAVAVQCAAELIRSGYRNNARL